MTADHLGRWGYLALAAFQEEGYADYVAMARPVDFASGRAALARGDDEMVPKVSGLYKRHELLVAFLLEHEGMTVDDLLAAPMDARAVERRFFGANLEP